MQADNKDLLYFLRMLESIGKILLYSKNYEKADDFLFSNDQRDYNASLLLMMHIGEQAFKISVKTRKAFPEIDWKNIRNFRNRVAHDYINIDKLVVFYIIKNDLDLLKQQLVNCINIQLKNRIFIKEELQISKGSIFYQHIDFTSFQDI